MGRKSSLYRLSFAGKKGTVLIDDCREDGPHYGPLVPVVDMHAGRFGVEYPDGSTLLSDLVLPLLVCYQAAEAFSYLRRFRNEGEGIDTVNDLAHVLWRQEESLRFHPTLRDDLLEDFDETEEGFIEFLSFLGTLYPPPDVAEELLAGISGRQASQARKEFASSLELGARSGHMGRSKKLIKRLATYGYDDAYRWWADERLDDVDTAPLTPVSPIDPLELTTPRRSLFKRIKEVLVN